MGALSDMLYEHIRNQPGRLKFSQEIEDEIDPKKRKEKESKATGERVKRGLENINGMRYLREELDKQNKPRHSGDMGVRG